MSTVRVIDSPGLWIEGEAISQLEATSRLEGMRLAVGLPDLHAGSGHPVGAAFVTEGVFHPRLVGGDIGCGMALFATGIAKRKARRDKWERALGGLEGSWDGDREAWLADHAAEPAGGPDEALGTIGGGNHFAEIQTVDTITDEAAARALGLDAGELVVMVHSGSRGLGQFVQEAHAERFGEGPVGAGEAADHYLAAHDRAVAWARANRALIAERMARQIGGEPTRLLDLTHNALLSLPGDRFLHRKGAAPGDAGPVVIPGSRGALSHVVAPTAQGADVGVAAASLAHGAGRRWSRTQARAKLQGRISPEQLRSTRFGGRVICEDRALLLEEAPEAYKDIEQVIAALEAHKLVTRVATLRPMITYKTRSR